jgi:hypothetical protein
MNNILELTRDMTYTVINGKWELCVKYPKGTKFSIVEVNSTCNETYLKYISAPEAVYFPIIGTDSFRNIQLPCEFANSHFKQPA